MLIHCKYCHQSRLEVYILPTSISIMCYACGHLQATLTSSYEAGYQDLLKQFNEGKNPAKGQNHATQASNPDDVE